MSAVRPSNPLSRNGTKTNRRGRNASSNAAETDSAIPQTPSRVQIRDDRQTAIHRYLQAIWNQAMPNTLTEKGQFPKKAAQLLEAKGLTWVLPQHVTLEHIYKKKKPVFALRAIEASLDKGLPRIVPLAAAPSSSS